jgi:hypothetical protein
LKLLIAIPNNQPDIKQERIDNNPVMLNDTIRHVIVKSKKVKLFMNSIKFNFFLPFL